MTSPAPVNFYGGPFSNFYPSPISLPHPLTGVSVVYPTVEHYFAASKASSLVEHEKIRHAPDPAVAKAFGRQTPLRPDWEWVKYDVMLTGLRAKFEQHEDLLRMLLDTGGRVIREDSPTDFEWGYRNGGKNLLGKALMAIREDLKGRKRCD